MPHFPSTLVRTARFARLQSQLATKESIELARLAAVPLATLDGVLLSALAIIARLTLVILVDAYRTSPERIAAEIGWVRERLDPAIELVLIWPQRTTAQARALRATTELKMYVDRDGDFRRLVSPGGRRVALLADPKAGTLERIAGTNAIFAVRRAVDGMSDRGTDHMIDLGDVHH